MCKGLLVHALPLDPKVYFISHLPVLVRLPATSWMVGIFAILVCLAATVWPAMHAARLTPRRSVSANSSNGFWAVTRIAVLRGAVRRFVTVAATDCE